MCLKGFKMTNIELIANSSKIKKIEDILLNVDLVADLLMEDVIKIIKKNGGYIDFDINMYYAEAIKWTKIQLNKHHLKLYKRIFTCGNIKAALQLILVRIVANIKNQFDLHRKGTVAFYKSLKKQEIQEDIIKKMNTSDPLELLLDVEMQILVKEERLEYLKLYKKKLLEIVKIKKNENNNLQMIISFESEED